VDYYYKKKAYLATSPQLYKQIMVGVFERVFSTPKVFRGEKHATTRHLSEYSTLDFEMGFIADHLDVMAVLERVVRAMAAAVAREHAGAFALLRAEPPLVANEPFPMMKLREAQELIFKETGADKRQEPDLEPEDERWLCEWAKKEKGSDFLFITHYPVSKRPFYTYEDEADKGFTKSFDLLFRGLEITTGGQRVHDYDTLVRKAREKGLDPEKFSFYLQAFRYGMPPHGGSATGLERFTARMLNLPNVKEATLFPRDLNRIDTLLHGTDASEN
jgi:nondiscriminating aspartyl-tRNA synthetase